MFDVVKAISSGIASFVFAWLLPSALTVTLFLLVTTNVAESSPPFTGLRSATKGNDVLAASLFTLFTLALATFLAYGSLLVYRVLEGYLSCRLESSAV